MERFFNNINGLSFIQIGAFDGVYQDPVRKYIKHYGWRGVLCEPQKVPFEKLVKSYEGKAVKKNIKFANVAIAEIDGEKEMFVPKRKNISSFTDYDPKLKIAIDNGDVEKVIVKTMTLNTFLDEYGIENIDVMFIDAEGYDYEIIKQIDFSKIRPHVINYEYLTLPEPWKCAKHLNDNGYYVTVENRLDAIAYERVSV